MAGESTQHHSGSAPREGGKGGARAASAAGADERPWHSHVDEFRAVRTATLALFQNLPADAWARRGVASGNPFTVRALAYITAGHVAHHVKILRQRYL